MTTHLTGSEIAVIGMAGRFPGARTLAEFWDNLQNGVESISHFSEAELRAAGIEAETLQQPNYVKARAILEDADAFDAGFFGLSPRDAEILDPQQRVFLETAWTALETAGYDPQRFLGAIGVYGGATLSGYLFNLYSNSQLMQTVGQFPLVLGNGREFLTTRTSYLLNLQGPSVTVQTACSTALVAVHLATQALLSGECDLALAGGVSIRLPLKGGYWYQVGGISSPDGHCRAFDARAQGTVGGSGVGLVVLKRLEEALSDRDTIYGVVKGSAINNDGAAKISYTAPRIEGQAAVIRAAQQIAEVNPETVQYIEAHGTGTLLGDPIEVAALTQAFQTAQRGYCAVGSVKTNIGHLDAAAGAAGLIKTLLALQQRQIPPSLHFELPNPQIDFDYSPFYVNTQLQPWPDPQNASRRAGVSSFGIGGTNAHVIVEEAPPVAATSESRPWQLLLWSAKTQTALEVTTQNLVEVLEQAEVDLADAAYTLQMGRQAFAQRRMAVCRDRANAIAVLTGTEGIHSQTAPESTPQVVFLLPGQGAQHIGMGQQLYNTEATFRQVIDHGAELLRPYLGLDLRQILYPDGAQMAQAAELIHRTDIAQPALFLVEYALAQLWWQWGVTPQVLIGHSLGEYVAACLAGVADLESMLSLVALRGRLMAKQPEGAMLCVARPTQQVMAQLPTDLVLAADNAPELCVVAGTVEAIARFQQQLTAQEFPCRRLKTSHAFHSPLMEGVLAPFRQRLSQIPLRPPQIPWLSNLTGTWITPEQAVAPDYWVQHLRQPVQFRAGLQTLSDSQPSLLLEVGPGKSLSTLARQNPAFKAAPVIPSLKHPHDTQEDLASLLSALGQLWLANVSIDWPGFYADEQRRRVPLPTYPFERQRYWIEAQPPVAIAQPTLQKRADLADWFYVPSWSRSQPLRSPVNAMPLGEPWLLFLDDTPLSQRIAEQLSKNVILVRTGPDFSRLDDHSFTLNPHRPEDYRALLNALGDRPTQLLHGWSLTSNPADFAEVQARGCQSLLYLTQALAQGSWHHALRLTVLTAGLFKVTGSETLVPAQSTLLGPCTVIPQEYQQITCRVVDWPESLNAAHLTHLLSELIASDTTSVVAYRHGLRWVQRFEPLSLPEATCDQTLLRHRGVYLITGGLGNIGLTLATALAPWQAKIGLLSRRGLPPRLHWPSLLESHSNNFICDKIRQIQAIEAAGAEVMILAADVADSAQLQAAIAQMETELGSLSGVVHAAGAVGEQAFRLISETGSAELEQQFQAKVLGLQTLAEILQGKPLDFCLLCSSLASILGGLGFSAYGAANQFMDAFAQQRSRSAPFPWISVNWDGWRFQPASHDGLGKTMADLALTSEEGIAVWQRILAHAVAPQAAVSTGDLTTRQQQWQPSSSFERPSQVGLKPTHHGRPALAGDYQAARNSVEQGVVEIWESLLGIHPIGIHDSFFDLGGHSLLATQIMIHLRQRFEVDIPLRCLFDTLTVAGIAEAIAHQQNQPPSTIEPIRALPRWSADEAQRLLDQLDQLPESEVNDLLQQFSLLQSMT